MFRFLQLQYFEIHPMGVIPVQINDVVFSVHATIFAVFTALQCIIYEVLYESKNN